VDIIHVLPEEQNLRIDAFLAGRYPDLSRTHVQKLLGEGEVTVNGLKVKPNYRLRDRDRIELTIPPARGMEIIPEPIPLNIVFEDADVIVVDKPQGMVVHPANGHYSGTMVNALLHHCRDLSGINGVLRPGIVHRIDKDTSGLLMVAKNDRAHLGLAEQLKKHSIRREYVALVHGRIVEPAGEIDAPIGRDPGNRKRMAVVDRNSKTATTHYRALERFAEYTLIRCGLETGRTHQIRVHMAFIEHPVVGDPLYGPRKPRLGLEGQALHAEVLGFNHPATGEYMEFCAPWPEYLNNILDELRAAGMSGVDVNLGLDNSGGHDKLKKK